jgi:large subunit ribosomal protein L15
MKLHDLKPNTGATGKRKRVGRGISAGQGKTAGRGVKGQGARAGGGPRVYHQGGNLPFFRRLPFKRGFSPLSRIQYNEINLDQLSGLDAKVEVNPETLSAARLLREPELPVAILGRGEVKAAFNVAAHRVSKGAKAKIEAAGGSVRLIEQ